jgi:small subunit ribosomal protein S1
MSWTKKIKHPSKMLEVDQEVACQVLEVDSDSKRISLGMKQLEPDPWSVFTDAYKPGDRITGKVRSITDYGVFVGIEEGVDGMVHKTDLSWTVKINNPSDVYQKGDDVEAIILSINHDEKKVSLGVRQLFDDPWATLITEFAPGSVIPVVEVLATTDYGSFVRIRDGVEAIIPAGEMPAGTELKKGDKVKAEIANVDTMDRRVTMSMLNPGQSPAAEQLQVMKRESTGKGATLGDLFKDKLAGMVGDSEAAPAAVPAAEAAPEAAAEAAPEAAAEVAPEAAASDEENKES